MPSTSKAQQRLFCMALAVRKGELSRDEVGESVLDIVDGDMSDEQIEHFTVLKESVKTFSEFVSEQQNRQER